MAVTFTVDVQYVDRDKAVFHVTRSPITAGASAPGLASLMTAALKAEYGQDWQHWMGKLAPLASTEGSTWKDRKESVEFERDDNRDWIKHEVTVRFWKDSDSPFKKQADGSYAASFDDLFGKK